MSLLHLLGATAAQRSRRSSYTAAAWDFDGSNDYSSRGDLTGASDSKQGTLSAWFRVDGGAGTRRTIFSTYNGAAFLQIELTAANKLTVVADNPLGSNRITFITSGAFPVGAAWYHALISWDLAASARHIYISDVSDIQVTGGGGDGTPLDYSTGAVAIGALPTDGSLKFNGPMSEFYFTTTYVDLSVEANRRKFISADFEPTDLGDNGELPTGAQPLIYTRDFETNLGSGGDFVITGSLAAASTSPSDILSIRNNLLADNGYSAYIGPHYDSSAFSRQLVSTDATAVTVFFYVDTDLFLLAASHGRIGVWVDTTYETILPTQAGWNVGTVSLAPGTKTVQLVNGARVRFNPGETTQGAHLLSALFTGGTFASRVSPTSPAARIVAYGDSVVTCASADPNITNGWLMKLRQLHGDSVMAESWYGRGLRDDGEDASARAAFVSRIAGYAPTTILLAVGQNDYGVDKWAADDFEVGYADLLDKLHAALPSTAIYAITPTVRTDESANAFGDTLGDYRTAISNACVGRAWATLVDGTAFYTTAVLVDGIHPNTTGHGLYYDAVVAELGL